jgi:hypothetical protein
MTRWLLRRILGEHTAHALECDRCFQRMMDDFIGSLS